MKNGKNMKRIIGIIVFMLLTTTVAFTIGCKGGGTDIRLEGVSLGTVMMEGKVVEGLPSEKVNLLLDVSTQEISIASGADGTVLTLSPSGATLEINSSGVSIRGLKPEQIKVEWVISPNE